MKKTLFFLLSVLPATVAAQNADTTVLSLSEAVERGLRKNANVEQARQDIRGAEYRVREARAQIWPEISINSSYTRNIKRPVFFLPEGSGFGEGGVIEAGFDNSFQATAQASMPLYNQQLFASADLAEISKQISRTGLRIQENEISAQIRQTYFNALLAQETVNTLELSLQNAQNNLEDVRNLFNQGLAPQYDVIRAEVQVENLKPDLIEARNNYTSEVNQLKLLIGHPADEPVALQGELLDYYDSMEKPNLLQYSITDNPNFVQLQRQTSLQKEQIDLEQAAYYPTLSLFGNYQYQAQANNFDFSEYRWINTSSAGIQLSIPVFSGFIRQHRINQARVELENLQIQTQYLRNSLTVEARNAIQRIRQAEENIEAQRLNIQQAEKGYEIARVSYEQGASTLLEVNDAELALTQARMNFITAINDYLVSLVDYNRITAQEYENENSETE